MVIISKKLVQYKLKNMRTKKKLKTFNSFREYSSAPYNYVFFIVSSSALNKTIIGDVVFILPPFEEKYSFGKVDYINDCSPLLTTQHILPKRNKGKSDSKSYRIVKLFLLTNLEAVPVINEAKKIWRKTK